MLNLAYLAHPLFSRFPCSPRFRVLYSQVNTFQKVFDLLFLKMAQSTRRSLSLLCVLFAVSSTLLLSVLQQLPELPEDHKEVVQKLPRDMEDAKNLARVLSLYRENHYYSLITCIAFVYIFLQTFAIPGTYWASYFSNKLENKTK